MTASDDRPLLPESTRDDTDEGWRSSDDPSYDDEADDVRRLVRERPPHHDRAD